MQLGSMADAHTPLFMKGVTQAPLYSCLNLRYTGLFSVFSVIFRLEASALFVLVQSVASREAWILVFYGLDEMNHKIGDLTFPFKTGRGDVDYEELARLAKGIQKESHQTLQS